MVCILSSNHISCTVGELSLISLRVNTHSIECKGKCLLAVKGFEIYHYARSFCVVNFFPLGEVGSVECFLLDGAYVYHLNLIEVAAACSNYFYISLSHFG